MKPTDKLVSAMLARLDDVDEGAVRAILAEVDLGSKERPPTRTQLTLKRLRFGGERSGDFTFFPGVNVIRAGNLKGKSTILQLIHLCLTGSVKLKPDMSEWITLVDLDFQLDTTIYTVHVDRTSKRIKGYVCLGSMDQEHSVTDAEHREFKSAKKLSETMESFFGDKLGFEVLRGTQKDSRKDRDDLLVNEIGYDTYFKGLYVNQESSYLNLVTDTFFSNQYTKIVGTLLGYRGLRPFFEAETCLALTINELAKEEAHLRRTESEATPGRALDEVNKEIDATAKLLDELKLKRAAAQVRVTSADVDQRLARLTEALIDAHEANVAAQQELLDAERAKEADETVVLALKDAIESKHHFSALTPHQCPVCESVITKSRTQLRQGSGQCLLCAESINPRADSELVALLHTRLVEADASLKSRESAVRSGRRRAQDAKDQANQYTQDKLRLQNQLRTIYTENEALDGQIERQIRRLGKLEAEREESLRAASRSAADTKVEELSLKRRVLEALVSHLRTTHGLHNEELKAKFSARVLEYLQKSGIVNIESIRLNAQLQPEMLQNGRDTAFSDLSPGEKVRFVLAFFFALAVAPATDIPKATHPGLLLIDSPGKEEMVEKDFKAVVELLQFVEQNHSSQVQAIVASSHRGIREAAPKEKVRFVDDDDTFLFS